MVNLLPDKTKRTLFITYYVRLGAALLFLMSGALMIGIALLTPSFVVAERAADSGERYLAALEETIGLRERDGVSTQVRALGERMRILEEYAASPSVVPLFDDLLTDLSSQISITGIGFAKGGDSLAVSIAGNAATRSALLAFADRLRESGVFDGVAIPVSQLARDTNIPFSITATYKKP